MAGMEEAIKNLMMQRAIQGSGAPTGGSAPMALGGQGMPMPSARRSAALRDGWSYLVSNAI